MRFNIITAAYNSELTIRACIESVASQLEENYLHIIVDDGSDDNTVEVVKNYIRLGYNIRLVECIKNQGAAAARNKAFEYCDTKWVFNLDSDDFFLPGYIRKVRELLQNQNDLNIGLLISDYVYSSGGYLTIYQNSWDELECRNRLMSGSRFGAHSAMCYNLEIVRKIGGFDERMRAGHDYDLWLRISQKSRVCATNQLGSIIVQRQQSLTVLNGGQVQANNAEFARRRLKGAKVENVEDLHWARFSNPTNRFMGASRHSLVIVKKNIKQILNYIIRKLQPPIIVNMYGGLGNQLFILYFGLSLANIRKKSLIFNVQYYSNPPLERFGRELEIRDLIIQSGASLININKTTVRFIKVLDKLLRVLNLKIIQKEAFPDYCELNYLNNCVMYDGYWQSYKYHQFCAAEIRNLSTQMALRTEKVDQIALHYRCFVTEEVEGADLAHEYYVTAIKICLTKGYSKFTIFTNDQALGSKFAHEMVNIFDSKIVVTVDTDGISPLDVIKQMNSHGGLIMSNSTLSWWAGYLMADEKLVLYPDFVQKNLPCWGFDGLDHPKFQKVRWI